MKSEILLYLRKSKRFVPLQHIIEIIEMTAKIRMTIGIFEVADIRGTCFPPLTFKSTGYVTCTLAPQFGQNLSFSLSFVPQLSQNGMTPPP
jgi:hypothetical protein